ncbi:hypothetical protein D3C71_1432410 [compost metagenome]
MHGLFVGDGVEVRARQPDGAGIFGAGQKQQLVDQPGGAFRSGHQLPQAGLHFFGAGVAQGQLGLRAQAGKRRLQLVRGVRHETALGLDVGG